MTSRSNLKTIGTMTQLTQTLLLICLIAAAMFSVVVIIVLCEVVFFLISERIKDVYRYASGKYKDHNDRQR